LNTDSGIFFEFIPAQDIFSENPERLSLKDVKVGVNYAMIINNNAGLWGYNLGDTVRFVSTNPYRLLVTGRIKHFISAFGEHVIGEEVEYSLMKAAKEEQLGIVEFEKDPDDLAEFALKVDNNLRDKNIYYDDLIRGNILDTLVIRPLRKNAFIGYMKSVGKLGGQNKVPRLSNDRNLAEALKPYAVLD
jgi:hypothetical protein